MSTTTNTNTGTSTLACVRCHRLGARNCSLCRSVAYCSTACQKKDWEFGHKIQCKEIRLKQQQQQQQQAPTVASGGGATNGVVNGIEKLSLNRTPSSGGVSEVDEESQLAYSSPTLSPPNRWLVTPTDIGTLCTARSRMPPKPVGLLNPKKANSCFYNVVLQTLTYTKPFINLIDQLQHTPEKCVLASQSKFCMICTFQHHREQVLKHSRDAVGDIDPASTVPIVPPQPNGEPKPILPVALLRNLDKLSSDYALGQQEDSHDTLKNLLHVWDEAWIKNYANATSSSSSSSSSTDVTSPLPRLSQRTLETTPISQLFGGYLLSEIKCETGGCRKFTSRFEFFLDLSLEIIQETDDLGEMLEAFSRPEKLDAQNLYKCSHCEKKSRARKQITIFQQPNILMIQLKRFRMGMFGKVNKYIKFPLELSLRKYMSGCKIAADDELLKKDLSATSELSVVYRLYAVIVHLDLMNVSSFGHYICFIRDPNSTKDEWFKFDDDTIERVSTAQVLKLNAYILFYQRSTPYVSKEEVSNEAESIDSVSSSVQPSVSSSPVSSPDSATSVGDGSTSSPVPPTVSDAPVQCVGGCGFWGKASTENRCSQCYRKWQEDQGLIPKSQPKPKPQEDDDDEEVTPAMQLLHNRRALAQIDSNPALQARLLTDTAFRAQVTQLRAQVAAQMSAINPSLASNGTTNSIGGGFLSDSSFAQQLRQQMENQRRLESMQREQLIASQSAQLPPNPVETKSSKAATEAPTAKVGRNDKCPCGSGRKFKVCHGKE